MSKFHFPKIMLDFEKHRYYICSERLFDRVLQLSLHNVVKRGILTIFT
jgi:hypothetical protein